MNKKLALILALILTLFLMGSVSAGFFDFLNFGGDSHSNSNVVEDGQYCTADEVAAYIKEFHKLPSNYITKSEARNLGWQGGPLKNYAPGKSIGGDTFTNRQHVLPGAFRGAELELAAVSTLEEPAIAEQEWVEGVFLHLHESPSCGLAHKVEVVETWRLAIGLHTTHLAGEQIDFHLVVMVFGDLPLLVGLVETVA